ncbi:hypothetical protein GUJ93_ZPchr0002g24084 [Zizania palustris]|uniref:Uncharacterized protein n=1 Tax=Zizania palustris TaxID=103762 RepID=A0A8J5VUK6_ZIZPA|nr:hypothetical protein GUJ93_ZPchr0002g24084 [Zizania palustris]
MASQHDMAGAAVVVVFSSCSMLAMPPTALPAAAGTSHYGSDRLRRFNGGHREQPTSSRPWLGATTHRMGGTFAGGVATGRFSNGRLSADFLSEALGCRLPCSVPGPQPQHPPARLGRQLRLGRNGIGQHNSANPGFLRKVRPRRGKKGRRKCLEPRSEYQELQR